MGRASVLCASLLFLLTVGGAPIGGQAPAPPRPGADDYLPMALREAAKLRYSAPMEAVAVYREVLRGALPQKDRIKVHVLLAECLERVKGEGEGARRTWKDIRDAYPDDPVNLKAAYRLGELYFCILPDGLKPSLPDALEQFEYILKKAPAGRMIALLAHVNVAQIRQLLREPDKALLEYQTVYDTEAEDLEVPPETANLPEAEREKVMKPLREQLARMRAKAVPRMIACCRRGTDDETVNALKSLKEKYNDDETIAGAVDAALKTYEPSVQPDADSVSFLPTCTSAGERRLT